MSHARVEELSDSDSDIDNPSGLTFPSSSDAIIAPSAIPKPGSSKIPTSAAQDGSFLGGPRPGGADSRAKDGGATQESVKAYSTLYPVYFDSSRSRQQGRRVSSKLATPNPLAREIAEACQFVSNNHASSRLRIALEPDKTHPKDWSNPGRVRVQLRDTTTRAPLSPNVVKKSHLYILVAEYLQSHPTTKESPLRLRMQGLPVPEKIEAPAVPRGWKINDIVPLHSPAMSGGGVSENFFKDMMADLQNAGGAGGNGGPSLPPGMAGMMEAAAASAQKDSGKSIEGAGSGSGSGSKKKNKKK